MTGKHGNKVVALDRRRARAAARRHDDHGRRLRPVRQPRGADQRRRRARRARPDAGLEQRRQPRQGPRDRGCSAGIIRKVICSYIGTNEDLHTRMAVGRGQGRDHAAGHARRAHARRRRRHPRVLHADRRRHRRRGGQGDPRDRRPPLHPRARAATPTSRSSARAHVRSLRQPPVLAHRAQLQAGDGDRREADDRRVRRARRRTARSIPTTSTCRASTSTGSSRSPSTRTRSSTRPTRKRP